MYKNETILNRVSFLIVIALKMLTPPIYSLERLEKYCREQIEKHPKAYSPRSFLAQLYKDYKKDEESMKEYEELKLLGYMEDDDWLNLGEILFRLENYQSVIETLAHIIDKYSKNKNANWFLGISYEKKGDYQKAVVYLKRIIAAGSRLYEGYWHLGICYSHLRNIEGAIDAYRKALAINSDSIELKKNLASVYIRRGQSLLDKDIKLAEQEFKKSLDIDPGNSEAIRILDDIPQLKKMKLIIEQANKKGN